MSLFKTFCKSATRYGIATVKEPEERSFAVGDLCVRVMGEKVKISRADNMDSFVEVNNDVYEFMRVFSGIQRVGIDAHLVESSIGEKKTIERKSIQ